MTMTTGVSLSAVVTSSAEKRGKSTRSASAISDAGSVYFGLTYRLSRIIGSSSPEGKIPGKLWCVASPTSNLVLINRPISDAQLACALQPGWPTSWPLFRFYRFIGVPFRVGRFCFDKARQIPTLITFPIAPKGVLTIFVVTSIIGWMMGRSQAKNKRRHAACPEEKAFLDLLRTTDMLTRGPAQVLKTEDLSATQYNVLRILRGAPEGLACGEIASRMITRDPDVTRLLDRLEKRSLISRCRETKDRRTVMARITPGGVKLVMRLDEPVRAAHRKQLGHLGRKRLRTLTDLLRAARSRVA
jgi:DNA-binding MarR family transcriptional regulator